MGKKIDQNDIMKLLDDLYGKSLDGIPFVSKSVDELVGDYTRRYHDKRKAAKALINNQVAKCTTSGFVTGFGGAVTLPITIPANIGSVLYVQMRMIAALAKMGGFNLNDDQTQTFVYACLAGVSVNQVVKKFGMQFGEKAALAGIKKIPGKVLQAINAKIGFRLFTKFGEKGLINLGKLVPVVGAVINGAFDFTETKAISARAYKQFIKHDFTPDKEEVVIDIDDYNEIS